MAERAHPDDPGLKNRKLGFVKNPYRKKLYERYLFCNQYIENKDICDVPCGAGWGTSLLKKYKSAIGFDVSQEAVDFANDKYKKRNCSFAVGDMASIPLRDDAIDVLICLEGFEHVD